MTTSIISCFCLDDFSAGNLAAVVLGCFGDRTEKQKMATELKKPVTVFIEENFTKYPLIEYFYPDTEMPLCIHGTLGAATILFKKKSVNQLTCITKGGLLLEIRKKNSLITIKVSAQQVAFPSAYKHSTILNLLDLKHVKNYASIFLKEFPTGVFSVGSPKLLIPVTSSDLLYKIKPNFKLLKEWSIQENVNGIYVYTPDFSKGNNSFVARGFNPKTGFNEDAATGTAAAALSLALKKDISVIQGRCLGMESLINVSYQNNSSIYVGGNTYIIK